MDDERDPRLTKHYRELESLEPPPELDRKILDAARRAALGAPAKQRRWYYPLAAAAVLVFAVALTLHLELERPGPEAVPAPAVRGAIKQAPKVESAPAAQPERAPVFTPDPQAAAPREPATAPRAAAPALADRAAATAAQDAVASAKQQAAAARLAAVPAAAPEKPEPWLERIAELRSRGRHAEADRELAAFRKAYPNYRLSEVMRERVEGTPAPAAQ